MEKPKKSASKPAQGSKGEASGSQKEGKTKAQLKAERREKQVKWNLWFLYGMKLH